MNKNKTWRCKEEDNMAYRLNIKVENCNRILTPIALGAGESRLRNAKFIEINNNPSLITYPYLKLPNS